MIAHAHGNNADRNGVDDPSRILDDVGFVHLHVHSSYSLREGAMAVAKLARLALADAMPAPMAAALDGGAAIMAKVTLAEIGRSYNVSGWKISRPNNSGLIRQRDIT
jgi:hypothetical protein